MANFTEVNVSTTAKPVTLGSENIPEVFPFGVDIILKILYVIISAIGIVANSLILYLVASKKVNLTPFNILLSNLSVADLVACILIYPYVFIDIKGYDVNKGIGGVLCSFTIGLTFFLVCSTVSLLSLTIISINRFICINYPLNFSWHQGKGTNKVLVACCWVAAGLILFPNLISFTYVKDWGICRREWPPIINGKVYSAFTAVLGLIVPFVVLFYTYIATLKNLRTKVNDELSARQSQLHQSRKRTIRLLGSLIVVFCACWAPFFIYWVLSRTANVFADGNLGDIQRMRVIRVTILIATFNSAADPFLYGLFSEQFQSALRSVFGQQNTLPPTWSQTVRTSCAVATVSGSSKTAVNASSAKSSFCMRGLEEEVTANLTPRSSQLMSQIRDAASLRSKKGQYHVTPIIA